jgi:hypothetical protein
MKFEPDSERYRDESFALRTARCRSSRPVPRESPTAPVQRTCGAHDCSGNL